MKLSLKPLWSGMGEVVPARTSPTLHPPSLPLFMNSLEQLIVGFIESHGVLPPELLGLVHGTPLQAARLQLRRIFIERATSYRYKHTELFSSNKQTTNR